jgi:hypothetical protein
LLVGFQRILYLAPLVILMLFVTYHFAIAQQPSVRTQGVNGECGAANGVAVSTAPTADLCASGTASAVRAVGQSQWTWSCFGSRGGSRAFCSAPVQSSGGGGGGGTTMTINDTDPSVIYSTIGSEGTGPTWFTGSDPTDYMNDEHYSNFSFSPAFEVNGADLVVNFNGTGITWIGKKGPNLGIASYSVDGGPPVTFDAYNASVVSQNNNGVISGLAPGSHSLKIEVTQTKNASSSDYYQTIDAFNITGLPLPLSQGAIAGYNSPELSFTGGPWTCGPDPSGADLSGGHCYTNATNASISWTFTGSLIEVYGRPDLEDGIFNVLIDGTQVGRVDGHFGSVDNDALNGYGLFQAKVAPGTHTIQLVNTGTADSAATNTFIQIDMFVAFP